MRTSLDKHYILAASATAFHLRFVSGPSRPDTHPQAPTRRAWEALTQTHSTHVAACGSLPEKLRDQGVQGAQPSGPPTQPSRPRLDEANVPRTQPRSSPSTPQEKSLRDPKHRTERRGPRPHRAQRHAGAIDPGALWATSSSGRTAPTPPSPFGATGRAKGTSPKARTDSAAAARTATSTSAYLARGTRRETARAPPLRHAPRAIP